VFGSHDTKAVAHKAKTATYKKDFFINNKNLLLIFPYSLKDFRDTPFYFYTDKMQKETFTLHQKLFFNIFLCKYTIKNVISKQKASFCSLSHQYCRHTRKKASATA